MTFASNTSGAEYLALLSDLTALRKKLPPVRDILVVEDEAFDSDRMLGTLRKIFGYELEIRRAHSLTSALDCVLERRPELVVLDDYLLPSDTALDSIPLIRRAQFEGPIIVVSGRLNRARCSELLGAGASATIHKDEVNSGTIAAAVIEALTGVSVPPPPDGRDRSKT